MALGKRKKKPMEAAQMMVALIVVVVAVDLARSADSDATEILLEIKRGFNNTPALDSWNTSSSTAPGKPPVYCTGDWNGVSCKPDDDSNTTFSVTSIVLPGAFNGGILSPAIGSLAGLQKLNLSSNGISGGIPPEMISKLSNLSVLDLSDNLLSGSLPPDWRNLSSLQTANLQFNRFNGSIPPGLFLAPRLQSLLLDGNLLSGEIPPAITASPNLVSISFTNNNLSGPIPDKLGNLTSLRSIYAGFNRLNGTLPDGIGRLPELQHLELENNEIHGSIPPSWAALLPTLRTLNLSDNNLTGQVPFALLQSFSPAAFFGNPGLCIGTPGISPDYYNSSSSCFVLAAPPRSPLWSPQHPSAVYPGGGTAGPMEEQKRRQERYQRVEIIVGAVVGGILLSLLVFILAFCWGSECAHRRRGQATENWFNVETQEGRRQGRFAIFDQAIAKYGYEDFVSQAGFFDTAHVVGKGRFATVYRSDLADGTKLAVKVFKYPISVAAFEREMEAMASIKHRFLLPIKAYYCDRVEKAVVYEYMPKGTLYALLHGEDESSPNSVRGGRKGAGKATTELPDWAMRQRIAYGVAVGLEHLHKNGVLHKDVQSKNVLVEEAGMMGRLADYGMVQVVSNRAMEEVVEKEGYTAPEVAEERRYSEKADVYGFGVVLLEVVTGRKAVIEEEEEEEEAAAPAEGGGGRWRRRGLAEWAADKYSAGKGREIMDTVAWKTCPFPEYLDTALKLAVACVSPTLSLRPPIHEAVSVLDGLASNPSPLKTPSDLFSP